MSQIGGVSLGAPIPALTKGTDNLVEEAFEDLVVKPAMGKLKIKTSVKKDKEFMGLDVDFGAAFIIGIDIKFKLGFEYEE